MVRYVKDNVNHIKYESLEDFFKNTNPDNPPATMHTSNSSNHEEIKGNSSWRYGDERSKSKFYQVRFDPTKGKGICAESVKKVMASNAYKDLIKQAMTYRKRVKYEDHGFRLSVPKAIGGEDRYFAVYKNSKKPVVKIAINICGSACVEQSEFIKLAETAIPTIYALEIAGIATEVYYTAFASGTHPDVEHTITHVKIKSAEQRFNWTMFAPVFCLGSYRESIFLSWIYDNHKVSGGLGRPMDSRKIDNYDNFGYTSVIGFNAAGPVQEVSEIFSKLKTK